MTGTARFSTRMGRRLGRAWRGAALAQERRWLLARILRRRGALVPDIDRTNLIRPGAILAFVVLRDEAVRLPWFLDHYRARGVDHFLIVDNDSRDGGHAFLRAQPDVSLWRTTASYRAARFGMDWAGWLMMRHGHGHWCVTVDPDELLVTPHDERGLRPLTEWLDAQGRAMLPAMLLDLYPHGPVGAAPYRAGDDPVAATGWFDPAGYMIHRNPRYGNLWIQGGPRARVLFAQAPQAAPALNKTPLVRWNRRYVHVSSTHTLLPRALNQSYDTGGGEAPSGILLHTKFLAPLAAKAADPALRAQHYAGGREVAAYAAGLARGLSFWSPESLRYRDWRQLDDLGLMSAGGWM